MLPVACLAMSRSACSSAWMPSCSASQRRRATIWLILIVALIVAGTLAYRAIEESGPKVVILFESAEGLEAGKSKVKYRDVEFGTVDLIQLHDQYYWAEDLA